MAYLPCDVGQHWNPGRNINVYLGLLGDGPDLRRSGRLCEGHWREIEPDLAQLEVCPEDPAGTFDFQSFVCPSCSKPVDKLGIRAFITAYPAKDDRKDYWANVHTECPYPHWLSHLVSVLR